MKMNTAFRFFSLLAIFVVWFAPMVGRGEHFASYTMAARTRPAASTEPPQNRFLADSPWPMSHRNPYNQASSPYAGPTSVEDAAPELLPGEPVPVTLAISSAYSNGRSVLWGTTLKDVFKVDASSGRLAYIDRKERLQSRAEAISGAYSVLDRDGNYFVPKGFDIECYCDQVPGEFDSPIRMSGTFTIGSAWQGDQDAIVGISLTYDGWIAFVTRRGVVGCLSRDLQVAHYLRLSNTHAATEISNSIAVDETGGIFVVTEDAVHRIQWNAQEGLVENWAVPYRSNGMQARGRLGSGSGTTPTLMGFGEQDQFVVIGDGQTMMNIVLIWRNDIPADWQGLPGRNPRIAAEIPATFGDPDARRSTTEQSLTVRGYEVVAVSNLYGELSPRLKRFVRRRMGNNINHATIYRSNQPDIAPYGVEKFAWNPRTREFASVWANREISCPNGIPTMSAETGLLYCIGQRGGYWTLEGLDWKTGESVFYRKLSRNSENNSFYAATEIGKQGNIFTGTFGGMLKFAPNDDIPKPVTLSLGKRTAGRLNVFE